MTVRVRWFVITFKRYYVLCFLIVAIFSLLISYTLVTTYVSSTNPQRHASSTLPTHLEYPTVSKFTENEIISPNDMSNDGELRANLLKQKVERLSRKIKKTRSIIFNSKFALRPNYNIHIFYYAWYANRKHDGQYKHWNHMYLPNWKRDDHKVYPTGYHEPPADIGSNYYPILGCYSSSDPNVIDLHMRQLKETNVGVIVLSWYPPGFPDSPVNLLSKLFEAASRYKIKIALHIEPYTERNPINLRNHLKTFFQEFGNHTALYRIKKPLSTKEVPLIYVYDSYLTPAVAWKELLSNKGNLSVRDTELDAIYIGLLVDIQHRYHIKKSQFNGFYTYFASNSFTYGSTWKNWRNLARFALQNGLIFIPSVGPGYIDTQIRPWNSLNTRHRRHGQYYDVAWRSALNNHVNYVSITSFNEWHEGTQIEPAQAKVVSDFAYLDYEPEGPDFYLNLTRWWIKQFEKSLMA